MGLLPRRRRQRSRNRPHRRRDDRNVGHVGSRRQVDCGRVTVAMSRGRSRATSCGGVRRACLCGLVTGFGGATSSALWAMDRLVFLFGRRRRRDDRNVGRVGSRRHVDLRPSPGGDVARQGARYVLRRNEARLPLRLGYGLRRRRLLCDDRALLGGRRRAGRAECWFEFGLLSRLCDRFRRRGGRDFLRLSRDCLLRLRCRDRLGNRRHSGRDERNVWHVRSRGRVDLGPGHGGDVAWQVTRRVLRRNEARLPLRLGDGLRRHRLLCGHGRRRLRNVFGSRRCAGDACRRIELRFLSRLGDGLFRRHGWHRLRIVFGSRRWAGDACRRIELRFLSRLGDGLFRSHGRRRLRNVFGSRRCAGYACRRIELRLLSRLCDGLLSGHGRFRSGLCRDCRLRLRSRGFLWRRGNGGDHERNVGHVRPRCDVGLRPGHGRHVTRQVTRDLLGRCETSLLLRFRNGLRPLRLHRGGGGPRLR